MWRIGITLWFLLDYNACRYYDCFAMAVVMLLLLVDLVEAIPIFANVPICCAENWCLWRCRFRCRCVCECHKNFMNDINGKFSEIEQSIQAMHKICTNVSWIQSIWMEIFHLAFSIRCLFPTSLSLSRSLHWFCLLLYFFPAIRTCVWILAWVSKQCDRGYLFSPPFNW